MSDGRLMRLAILCILLLAPLGAAAPPTPNRSVADDADGQDITDLAVDSTGQFAAAVVAYTARVATLPLGGGTANKGDVFLCDYGAAGAPSTGQGCRRVQHQNLPTTTSPGAQQRVDATHVDSNGRQGYFAVAGPASQISYWRSASNLPDWSATAQENLQALNITLSSDARLLVVGTAPASATAGGFVEVRDASSNGALKWRLALQNNAQAAVRPTSLDLSRTGSILAIGTTDGLLVTDPTTQAAPTAGTLGGIPQADVVNRVMLSSDGRYVVAAASNGIFLASVTREAGRPVIQASTVFNRGFGTGAQDAAFALDGSRFAAAAGSSVHFYRRLDNAQLAEPLGSRDLGAPVSSIAYDARGQILVALAGNRVYGFGPDSATPIWEFDATVGSAALDGPLRKVVVSDDAQRIVIAGKTRTTAYTTGFGVAASLASSNATSTIGPTQRLNLTLTLNNTGSLVDDYNFSVITPVGWQSPSLPGVRLAPNATHSVRFEVEAPAGSEPRTEAVQVRVRSAVAESRNPTVGPIATPSFNLTIPRSVVLKVEAPDDRLLLRQGGEQTVSITLRNEGNARGLVNLTARQDLTRGSSWDVRFTPAQIEVPPASTAQVLMLVTAPSDAGSGDRNIITIRAQEGEVTAVDNITAYVDAQFGAELRTNQTTWELFPGQVTTIRLNVTNIGNTEDVYNLTHNVTPIAYESDWRVTIETAQLTVARGQTKQVAVTVKAVASDARDATLTLRATSQSSPDRVEGTLVLNLVAIPRPVTPTDDDRLIPAPALAPLAALALLALLRRGGRR